MRFGFSWVVPGRGETVVINRAAIKELRNLIRPPFRPSMRCGRFVPSFSSIPLLSRVMSNFFQIHGQVAP